MARKRRQQIKATVSTKIQTRVSRSKKHRNFMDAADIVTKISSLHEELKEALDQLKYPKKDVNDLTKYPNIASDLVDRFFNSFSGVWDDDDKKKFKYKK